MYEADRTRIRRVFRRRRVSRDTFLYLCAVDPGKASVDEIAKNIGASRTSVIGALRGLGTRYKEEESLEHFGLVSFKKKSINQNTVFVYGLTPVGLKEKGLAYSYGTVQDKTGSEVVEPTIEEK